MSWTEGLETTCREQGADGFVRKSGGPNELVEAILAAGARRAGAAADTADARGAATDGDLPSSAGTGI
jgi:DNA-binding NarL/FixJ family response regulator